MPLQGTEHKHIYIFICRTLSLNRRRNFVKCNSIYTTIIFLKMRNLNLQFGLTKNCLKLEPLKPSGLDEK